MGGDLLGIVVIFGIAGLALTLALSRLTARLIAGLSRVPIHFGLDLEPDSYGPPWVAVWLAPGLQLGIAALMVVCILLHLPTHGDPLHGALLASGGPAIVQGVFYVLLRRWRQNQP